MWEFTISTPPFEWTYKQTLSPVLSSPQPNTHTRHTHPRLHVTSTSCKICRSSCTLLTHTHAHTHTHMRPIPTQWRQWRQFSLSCTVKASHTHSLSNSAKAMTHLTTVSVFVCVCVCMRVWMWVSIVGSLCSSGVSIKQRWINSSPLFGR